MGVHDILESGGHKPGRKVAASLRVFAASMWDEALYLSVKPVLR